MDFLNFTFNLHFHFWFWKPNSQKLSRGRSAVFSLPHIADELKEGSLYFITLSLWSIQHGGAGSAAGRFFLVRILIEFSVLAAQQNIQTAHYPLLQQRGLVPGHLITKLQLWRPAKTI